MSGDEERPVIQPKVSGGISLQVPKLNGTNYITWVIVVEAILDDKDLWDAVQPEEGAAINAKKNKTAKSFLFQLVDGDILLQISQYKNARDIWTTLKARYVGAERVQKARLLTLKSEFEKLKMAENETVDELFEQDALVKKLLDAVPDKYFQLVASIEQSVDLDSLMVEDAIGRLKAFEERLQGRERASESQSQLLFNRSESSYKGKSSDQSGSLGKGWSSSQGRGRGREIGGQDRDDEDQDGCENRGCQNRGPSHKGQKRTNDRQKGRKDRSQVQCYRCDEFGHFVAMFPERMKKKEESNLNKVDNFDPSLFMIKGDQKTILLNEDD
ncbi:uncharacterized protein LOC143559317, partial [Bidens hawaiensis]|uniref:uncharacterized protein LOC143559317 n=1 Tax=Bidens hawaiensis TaxID=980011 RepID=UPI00404930A7